MTPTPGERYAATGSSDRNPVSIAVSTTPKEAPKPTTAKERAKWLACYPQPQRIVRLSAQIEQLEERHLRCESIVEESDEWKRIAQGTSEGRRLAEIEGERDELRGHIAALVAGDSPLIVLSEPNVERCVVCGAEQRTWTPMQHREGCAFQAASDALTPLAKETHKEAGQ